MKRKEWSELNICAYENLSPTCFCCQPRSQWWKANWSHYMNIKPAQDGFRTEFGSPVALVVLLVWVINSWRCSLAFQLVGFWFTCLNFPASFLKVNIMILDRCLFFSSRLKMIIIAYFDHKNTYNNIKLRMQRHTYRSQQMEVRLYIQKQNRFFTFFALAYPTCLVSKTRLQSLLELGRVDRTIRMTSVPKNGVFHFRCEMAGTSDWYFMRCR